MSGGLDSLSGARAMRDIFVVALALAVLLVIVWRAFDALTGTPTASDIAAILGVILGPLAAIAVAAFGITYTAQSAAGAAGNATTAATNAVRDAAQQQTSRMQRNAQEAHSSLQNVEHTLGNLTNRLQVQGVSEAGSDRIRLQTLTAQGNLTPVDIPINELNDAREQLSEAQARLASLS